MEAFIRCEGKIGLSYATIRNRLHEIIRALGYEVGALDEPAGLLDAERQRILEELDQGRLNADEAMRLLKEYED